MSGMDRRLATTIEIETLHELLPELDYYRLLLVEPACKQEAIDPAWRRESRRLHPDRFASFPDAAVRDKANEVFRAVSEAWRVLKDPEARNRYDQERVGGSRRVSAEAVNQAEKDRAAAADPELAATHPKAEKYWKMALQNWREGNWKGCVMQIQFALTFEPTNAVFLEWMDKAKAADADKVKKTDVNPYKIRIV